MYNTSAVLLGTDYMDYYWIHNRSYSEDAINPGLHKWQIAAIAIDVILGLAICALEVLAIRGYQKRKK